MATNNDMAVRHNKNASRDISPRAERAILESRAYFQHRGADSILVDELVAEHEGHYPNFVRNCRLCIYRATRSVYVGDRNSDFARAFLASIDRETRHYTVIEVARLLHDPEMKRLHASYTDETNEEHRHSLDSRFAYGPAIAEV